MPKCKNCGKRTSKFYCNSCKQKEIKKMKQRSKANQKRRLENEMRKFEDYLKSGRRTY